MKRKLGLPVARSALSHKLCFILSQSQPLEISASYQINWQFLMQASNLRVLVLSSKPAR